MDFSTIGFDVSDQICTITLDRPDRLNAFDLTMLRDLLAAFDLVDRSDEIRVVIVTGAGRAFCAGADLAGGADSFDYERRGDLAGDLGRSVKPGEVARDGGGMLTLRIFRCTKPVIAAVNGAAVGIGATMTLPMDIRLAADTARIGFVFNARGLVPEAASSWFLPRLVGMSQALEWVYTARLMDAEEALRGGLVRSLHPPEDLLGAARALAAEIIVNSAPVSAALSRMMMWRMLGAGHPMDAHRVDSRAVQWTGASADAREGITAFFEKRPAVWSGSVTEGLPPFVPWWDEPEFT